MPDIPKSLEGLSPTEKRMLLARLLQDKVDRQDMFPMSEGQQGLWLHYQVDPHSSVYNISLSSHFRSHFDVRALESSFETLIARHASLRTTFGEREGHLVQQVRDSLPLAFEHVDATDWTEEQLQTALTLRTCKPFDLATGPLIRFALFRQAADDHVLLAVAHHIAIDFWSLVVLLMELREIYPAACQGYKPKLAPVTEEYANFVRWQAQLLESDRGGHLRTYWQQQLAGVPHVLELPIDFPRPTRFTHRAGVVPCRLPEELTAALNRFAAQENVTPYSLLLAAYQLLLGRTTGQHDFVIGTPFVGRTRPGFESTVGYFVNMLPLRTELDDDLTFRQYLHAVGEKVLEALEHQDYPFPRMVELLGVARDPSTTPLVQATLTLERSQRTEETGRAQFLFPESKTLVDVGGLLGKPYYVEHPSCLHELELVLEQAEGRISGVMRYCSDLFAKTTIRRLVDRFQVLLRQICAAPDTPLAQLRWFSSEEEGEVLQAAAPLAHNTKTHNTTITPARLHQYFDQQAERTPTATALIAAECDMTYAQLQSWSNRLAHQLRDYGVGQETPVVLCLPRSPEMIALTLAALKAGGVAVPLEPNVPPQRLNTILSATRPVVTICYQEDAQRLFEDLPHTRFDEQATSRNTASTGATRAGRVVTIESLCPFLPKASKPEPPSCDADPNHLAYIIFTSGSTGEPKGVMVEHQAISNTLNWRRVALPVNTDDRVLWTVPCSFDASLSIAYSTLCQGGALVIVPPGEERNPTALLDTMAHKRVTVLPAPPSLLHLLAHSADIVNCRDLRQIQSGGEALSLDLRDHIVQHLQLELVNLYGPTEAAVEATCWISTSARNGCEQTGRTVSIGRPITNVQTWVLDQNLRPVPKGVAGELCIGGAGLARGYLNDTAQSAERFISHPFSNSPDARLYRSGDCCRWLESGELEFLGRLDQQVKIRGNRVELAEIERQLMELTVIAEAAVIVNTSAANEQQLVAFVVPEDAAGELNSDDIQRDLRRSLPSYMVPGAIVTIEKLPRTSNGKLDRQSLPQTDQLSRKRPPFVAATNPLQHFLVDTCTKILQTQRVGMRDSFYELGGTSIQGATLLAMLQDELAERLETAPLFELTRIDEIAAHLAKNYPNAVAHRFGTESLETDADRSLAAQPIGVADALDMKQATPGRSDLIVPLQPSGSCPPLFMVHPPGGIVICYQALAQHLGTEQPLLAIRARGLHGEPELPETLEAMAAEYVAAMRSVQATGPYYLGGWSLGGLVAYEMAQQLLQDGQSLRMLALIDTTIPDGPDNTRYTSDNSRAGREYGLDLTLNQLNELSPAEQLPYLWNHACQLGVIDQSAPQAVVKQVLNDLKRLFHAHLTMATKYTIKPYPDRITLIRPQDAPILTATAPDRGWKQLAREVEVHFVPGQHHSMMKDPHVRMLADILRTTLA